MLCFILNRQQATQVRDVAGRSGSGGGTGGSAAPIAPGSVLGGVSVHVAAAKDGTTLFWAAREGGAPVAVRWRRVPSDGPWRVTLPLESPTFGLPPPSPLGFAGAGGQDPGASGRAGSQASGGAVLGQAPGPMAAQPRPGGEAASAQSGPATAGGAAAGAASPGLWAEVSRGAASSPAPLAGSDRPLAHSAAGGAKGAQPGAASPAARASASGRGSGEEGGGGPRGGGGPSITLLLSADAWAYKDATPPGGLQDGPRRRSLVLQVLEARHLASRDWAGTCDPYCAIAYDGRTYRSRTIYNAHWPVWHQTFVLRDNPSLLARHASLLPPSSGTLPYSRQAAYSSAAKQPGGSSVMARQPSRVSELNQAGTATASHSSRRLASKSTWAGGRRAAPSRCKVRPTLQRGPLVDMPYL
ncbi:hypothetical protein TSOC_012445, partial [Tetrabaena socialis]